MTVDELHQTFASVADRFRDELRSLQTALGEVIARAGAEKDAAVQDAVARARAEAEARGQEQLAAALAEADTRARTQLDAAVADADARSRTAADHASIRAAAEREEAVARARAEAKAQAATQLHAAIHEAEERGRQAARDERTASATSSFSTEDTVPTLMATAEQWQVAVRDDHPTTLLEAFRGIERVSSLTDILDAILGAVQLDAARVALLLRSGDELRGWRFRGFGSVCEPASSVVVLPEGSGILGDAVQTGALVAAKEPSRAPWFAQASGETTRLALPIALGGEVVALLYADNGPQPPDRPAMSAADIERLDLVVRYGARCLEAAATLKALGLATQRGAGASRAAAAAGSPDDADSGEAARRYARLLVSEIKLYHEPAVAAGRRERDLSMRLGGEIARARALYDQRVPQESRGQADYFHDELIRTLADGDASLLEKT